MAGNPNAAFVGPRPKMYSCEAVKNKPDGTTLRYDKQRAKVIQRAAGDRFLHQQCLDQLHKPTENYALTRRVGCRLDQIYCSEASYPSNNDQTLALHDPFLRISAPVPTCHDPFLRMFLSVPLHQMIGSLACRVLFQYVMIRSLACSLLFHHMSPTVQSAVHT